MVASSFVLEAAVATLVWWRQALRRRATPPAVKLLGTVGVMGAATFGLIRAVSDTVEVIR